MIELTRRDLARGVAVASSALAATAVSACSPGAEAWLAPERYKRFFQAIARGQLAAARDLIGLDTRLVIATEQQFSAFQGSDVIAPLANLLKATDYRLIGDTAEQANGGWWSNAPPWHVSNIVPGGKVEYLNCGTELSTPVLSVFVRSSGDPLKIAQILVMQTYTLATGFGGGLTPPPADLFDKKKNG